MQTSHRAVRSISRGQMTGSEARALFDQSHGPFMELASAITDAQWLLPCGAEAWPVGYVVHHVGQGYERPLGWIEQATTGHGPFHFDWNETHELNAQTPHSDRNTGSPRSS